MRRGPCGRVYRKSARIAFPAVARPSGLPLDESESRERRDDPVPRRLAARRFPRARRAHPRVLEGRTASSRRASPLRARTRRSSSSTRARRRPTAAPALTTSSRASSRTSFRATRRCAATACRARRAGTRTACRSSSRSSASSASTARSRSRTTASPSSTASAARASSPTSRSGSEFTERIGFWVDLGDAYYTFTNEYIETVWWLLRQIWDKGLLYQGYKVVPYCPRCGTAISSHEVAQGYKDVTEDSLYVRFPLTRRGRPSG